MGAGEECVGGPAATEFQHPAPGLAARPRRWQEPMHNAHGSNRRASQRLSSGSGEDRHITTSLFLKNLTVADGEWLGRVLPTLQRRARPHVGAVRVEDVALRYRPGRLSVADALDATAALLEPFALAGAELERRGEWYICDEDDEDDESLFASRLPTWLQALPDEDLLVSVRMLVDADGDDSGAASLYWAALALADD